MKKTDSLTIIDMVDNAMEVNHVKKQIQITDRFILQTLTSVGYDPYSAIYELIDNSKDAGATEIHVIYDKERKTLVIEDNGKGMSEKELNDGIDLGSMRDYYEDNVGYFGVGMNTSILNLFNKPSEDIKKDTVLFDEFTKNNIVFIDTNNGFESTKISWKPWFSVLDVYNEVSNKTTAGTRIEIHNVKNFNTTSLKKNLGVIYYKTLKNDNLKIYVTLINGDEYNESLVIYNDPLYRHEQSIQSNYVDATVCGEQIRLTACLMSDLFEKHSWDSNDNGFSYNKGGVYFVYGGRYIEYGGTFGATTYQDPWFSKTRIEVEVPKHLTEIFGVKFNKTNGIVSLDNPLLGDFKQKVKDLLAWGTRVRKANTNQPTNETKEETDRLTKKLNKSAVNAGFKKPVTSTDNEGKVKVGPFFADPNKKKKEEEENKEKKTPQIKERKLYDIKIEDLGVNGPVWVFNPINNLFTITINMSSSFYLEIYEKMNEESKFLMLKFVASLAMAEYESMQVDFSKKPQFFWENFWADFTRRLNHIINS